LVSAIVLVRGTAAEDGRDRGDRWTLVVSKEPSGFHTRYNPGADLGRVPLAKSITDGIIEQLTFLIRNDPSKSEGGEIVMAWESTLVTARFSVVQ